jgi:hypothetical protein
MWILIWIYGFYHQDFKQLGKKSYFLKIKNCNLFNSRPRKLKTKKKERSSSSGQKIISFVGVLMFFKKRSCYYIHISHRVGILCKPLPAAYPAASPLLLY